MSYSGSVMVTAADPAADGEVTITITASDAAGNAAEAATVMVTLDNTAPVITAPSADMSNVMAGDTVMISAMVEGATSVSADASALNADASMLELTSADGMSYTGSVMVTAADPAADGEATITITASDAAGNAAEAATVMVTLDNTMPDGGTAVSADPMDAKNGDTVMISQRRSVKHLTYRQLSLSSIRRNWWLA